MTHRIIQAALPAALAIIIAACSGAGGLAGIGGSGYIATGTITGFGSVFVNGIEFETDTAEIEVDGDVGKTQDDLAIGMVVTVSGSVNDDGVSGNALSIVFDDDVQGPVSNILPVDAEGSRSFEVFGLVVHAGPDTTFGIDDDIQLPAGTVFDIGTIANGDNVEVSGFFDGAGDLLATRIELKNPASSAGAVPVELKGTITGLVSTTFSINGIAVDASTADLEDLPNGLAEGQFVEVKGSYDGSTLTATRIEAEDGVDHMEDTSASSVEGLITDFVDNASFRVNGIAVDASAAGFTPASLVLRDGLRVEVEGPIVGGVLKAVMVEARSGEVRIQARVSTVTAGTGSFGVKPVASQDAIAITVTTATEVDDPVNVDDFVELRGFVNDAGGVTATRVELKDPDDGVLVQGVIDSITGSNITVLGVEFLIDYPNETEFEDANDAKLSQSGFMASVSAHSTVVAVEDRDPANGYADRIEIKSP